MFNLRITFRCTPAAWMGFFCALSLFAFSALPAQDDIGIPDFSRVQGFGFDTKGGKGGTVIKVTNLNSSGPGSLKEAISAKGPRIVVFEVGGVIDLGEQVVRISNPNITIAGQTAPSPGITLIKGGLEIATHEVIIQHIRIRPGEAGYEKSSGWEIDGLTTGRGAYNVVVDHCSFTWATDENLSISGPRFDGNTVEEWRKNTSHKILFSYNLIAEGLSHSTHAKGQHSTGSLVHDNTTEIAIVRNLYAHNFNRNPLFKAGSQGVIINNYIYNPGQYAIQYHLSTSEWEGRKYIPGKLSVVGNVVEFGRDTDEKLTVGIFSGPCDVFWTRNYGIRPDGANVTQIKGSPNLVSRREIWPRRLRLIDAGDLVEHLLQEVGARPWDRDSVDERIIAQVRSKQGGIINDESEVGGYPEMEPSFKVFNPDQWGLLPPPTKTISNTTSQE